MGEPVATLEDLLRPGLRAVCIGINPSPVSVGRLRRSRSRDPWVPQVRPGIALSGLSGGGRSRR